MKVLYLANGLPHYYNLVLSKLNAAPDTEVLVVVPRQAGRYIGAGVYQTRAGVDFRIVELEEYSFGPVFGSFSGLWRLVLKERPDVIVMPDYLLFGFAVHPGLVLARMLTGSKLVMKSIPFMLPDYRTARTAASVRASLPKTGIGRLLKALGLLETAQRILLELRAYAFRLADAHVNYIDDARQVYGSYGVPAERIFVTRNSPDTDVMLRIESQLKSTASPPRRSSHRLLHVGRLVATKRVDLLLDAFALVVARMPHAELVIVGDGPARPALQEQAQHLGLAASVSFTGALYDPAELGRHFLTAGVFVLPGLGGLSINEAMFYGLPVICAACDGTERHLVREGESGTYFADNDAASLAGAIVRLISDPEGLVRMGQETRRIIEQEVNIHTVIAEYLKAFHYACGTTQH